MERKKGEAECIEICNGACGPQAGPKKKLGHGPGV